MTRHVEIVGGGIGGMSAAAAFAQRGWSVRVHERASEIREEGAALGLGCNAAWALKEVGADHVLTRNGSHYEAFDDRGRRFLEGGAKPGEPWRNCTVIRSELLNALAEQARRAGVEIRTGSAVASADPRGLVTLEGGERFSADLVVGADGIWSTVRGSIRGARLRELPYCGVRAAVPYEIPDLPLEQTREYWQRSRRMGVSNVGPGLSIVFGSCPRSEASSRRGWFGGESWARSFPQLRGLMLALAEQDPESHPMFEVRCRSWSDGRLVVIGDAAHGMASFMGQGGCLAMQDGVTLAAAVGAAGGERSIEEALAGWEQQMRRATDPTRNFSRFYMNVSARWPTALSPLRTPLLQAVARMTRVRDVMDGVFALSATGAPVPGRHAAGA